MIEGRPRESLVLYEQPTEVGYPTTHLTWKELQSGAYWTVELINPMRFSLRLLGCPRCRYQQNDESHGEIVEQQVTEGETSKDFVGRRVRQIKAFMARLLTTLSYSDYNAVCELHLGFKKAGQLPPMEKKPIRAEEVLNTILPPREWVEHGKF